MKQLLAIAVFLIFISSLASAEEPSHLYGLEQKHIILVNKRPKKMYFEVAVPQNIPDQQTVESIEYSQKPSKVFIRDGNKYARFNIKRFKSKMELTVKSEVRVHPYGLRKALEKRRRSERFDRQKYLGSSNKIDKYQMDVRLASKPLRGSNQVETLENIFKYLEENMTYEVQRSALGSTKAVQFKKGDCSEFSSVFVAFARSHGIPARMVTGVVPTNLFGLGFHAWVEVNIPRHGWIPLEPQRYKKYDSIPPSYIRLIQNPYDGNRLFDFRYWGGDIDVLEDYSLELIEKGREETRTEKRNRLIAENRAKKNEREVKISAV